MLAVSCTLPPANYLKIAAHFMCGHLLMAFAAGLAALTAAAQKMRIRSTLNIWSAMFTLHAAILLWKEFRPASHTHTAAFLVSASSFRVQRLAAEAVVWVVCHAVLHAQATAAAEPVDSISPVLGQLLEAAGYDSAALNSIAAVNVVRAGASYAVTVEQTSSAEAAMEPSSPTAPVQVKKILI